MKVKCIAVDCNIYITIGKEYDVIPGSDDFYRIMNDRGIADVYDNALFEVVLEPSVLKPNVKELLTISSFITSMPTASRTGVFQEADKYTIFAYDAEYYADTEERLQEVMEALLVLYKEG